MNQSNIAFGATKKVAPRRSDDRRNSRRHGYGKGSNGKPHHWMQSRKGESRSVRNSHASQRRRLEHMDRNGQFPIVRQALGLGLSHLDNATFTEQLVAAAFDRNPTYPTHQRA